MVRYLLVACVWLVCWMGPSCVFAQQPDAAAIKKQMSDIRKSTNWDDPVAAQKANEKIKILSQQLLNVGKAQNGGGGSANPSQPQNQVEEAAPANQKMEMWGQVAKSAAQGKAADILLAGPVREEIKDEYRQEELPFANNSLYRDEMTVLVIDMSSNNAQLLIDQMENFKSVRTLVVTGGKAAKPIDLEVLLAKAKHYPLQGLYIINFGPLVSNIPKTIEGFSGLKLLALYNNNIAILPTDLSLPVGLKKLYVDMNPLATLIPAINHLCNLDTLGLAQTRVSVEEQEKINQQLPNCKLLLQ